jgi:curved DNA-binding protein
MEFKDYYALPGVEPEADEAAIKTAYRRLACKYHPDISQEKDAKARFKEVAELVGHGIAQPYDPQAVE